MKKKILILMGTLVLLTPNHIWAQEKKESSAKYDLGEVIVTATKTEQYQAEVGSSCTVITAEDIERTGKKTVHEVLRDVAGVSVAQSGSFGATTSVYLRGSNVGHTLVLIDGIDAKDPMQMYGGFFDFAHLTTDNIERIEVIKGHQSPLYGSDAIGGVINIITKKGKGKPKLEIFSEGGSHNTFRESMGISGGTEKTDYSFSVSRLDSDGISKAVDGAEEDGYQNTTISSKIGYKISDNSELNLTARFTDAETDADDGSYNDDINHTTWWKNFVGKFSFKQAPTSLWDHKLSFSYSGTRRKYKNGPDSVDTTENTHNWYKGEAKKFEWQHNVYPVDWDTLTCGFEYEDERGFKDGRRATDRFDRKKVNNKGYYLQNQFKLWESLYLTPGLRIDDHELSGTETTYKISNLYLISQTGTRLKANWGTGFKAPSVYQLYSNLGDLNLKPEKSKGYDFGIEQNFFNNNLSLGAAYFHNDFKNLISYNSSTSKYENINKAKTKGVELEFSFKPIETLKIGSNYTYTKTKNKDTGKKLTRRPQNQIGFNINWAYSQKGNLNLGTSYTGHRWNNSANTRKIKHYVKMDISTSYNLSDNIQIFGRIENVFDRKYQEVLGYATPGRSFYGGSKVVF
ncbi:MAG: TonB-dependent receptor [Candidatus Omnitrophota bacterium]|nr:MAG: TonB-dependent receptor [Candidatus Omnitrophota bacterium]